MASFDSADGYRAMARQAGAAVSSFRVRHQFADGNLVCSVIDWEMSMLPGMLTSAELLEVRDGVIVRGELIYDAENLRRAMAQPASPDIRALLDRCLGYTADTLTAVSGTGWDAPSPCTDWTVRQVANHVVGWTVLTAKIIDGEPFDPAELDGHRLAATDQVGSNPAEALREAARKCVAAFTRPGSLQRRVAYPAPDTPGLVLANVCLMESLVHGWDIARGAGLDYRPDGDVVDAVRLFAAAAIGDEQRQGGLVGPAVPVSADADALTALLGHLGRRA